MGNFINTVLSELKANQKLASEPLISILTESTEKSVRLGDSYESIYSSLKKGLVSIYEKTNNPDLEVVLIQFKNNENTLDSKVISLAKEVDLSKSLGIIESSKAWADPNVKYQAERLKSALANSTPDFALAAPFIEMFEKYNYDKKVSSEVSRVKKYLAENQKKLVLLDSIYTATSLNSPSYVGVLNDLKEMAVTEKYSADILKIKYGNSVPFVNSLIESLRLIESKETGNFHLGEGNWDTKISNLIAPAIKTKDGILLYMDNRFLSIREAKGLTGNESNVWIDSSIKISDFNPTWVKENYSDFYSFCESYYTLGFSKLEDGSGIESKGIRNFKIGFRLNENKSLDLYLNDSKVESLNSVNISEALVLEGEIIKNQVNTILEGSKNLFNFEFIKEVSNDRVLKESLLFNINNSFYLCEKLNTAERSWKRLSEYELYEFFKNTYNYDISNIFKNAIDEESSRLKEIEETKKVILENIEKLEKSVTKLNEATLDDSLDHSEISKLESLKEEISKKIHQLKKEYIEIDLQKKND
jgi:hypothetical protein